MTGPPAGYDELAADPLRASAEYRPDGSVVLRCRGGIDAATAPPLSVFLIGWVDRCCCVELDLSGVDHLAAAGLAAVLTGCRHADREGRHLRLGPGRSPAVGRALAAARIVVGDRLGPTCPQHHRRPAA
ncbi:MULTISPECIES: STAS domain-containing protein [Pseudonocardia]|uniref:STAS domain-containing protein n=2 Tax=Pseudonocardia TaxID=1847 RepID=A0A1Y2MJ24_PSEAH|nr:MULTISPECIES: STAS domain-containing protein [Pseudonocardia]OSY35276.1 hypothetical protein BG845_06142 [Pseudonocardia autotrophica]TDN73285.1 anti-anti-sigma factor [Pseudonocardia autotrophica]BBG04021.1 hypothetical protein Pdca_52300 [Pseudonocardia autotrophica]GEC27727.1 hypothetical protein PSA01_47560 [Pseudonocardia saturnea]